VAIRPGAAARPGRSQPPGRADYGGAARWTGEFTDVPGRRHWHAGAGCAVVRMV